MHFKLAALDRVEICVLISFPNNTDLFFEIWNVEAKMQEILNTHNKSYSAIGS